MGNFLSIRRSDIDEERFRLFTEDVKESKTEEITNEELQAAEKEKHAQDIFEFFGYENGPEGLAEAYKDFTDQLAEATKDEIVKVEDLVSETEDPFHEKKFEAEQTVFQKRRIEDLKEQKKDSVNSYSTSTDWVKDDKPFSGYTSKTNTYNKSGYSYNSNKTTGYGNNQSTNKDGEKEARHLNQDVGYIAGKVQDVAAQKIVGWKEKVEEEGWGGKPSWKRRFRNFFKTKKARILLKTSMLMTLQLGMAMVGKKYEFEGTGQMAMFLGMMMGVFYLTRELVEDGFDPRGFGIL